MTHDDLANLWTAAFHRYEEALAASVRHFCALLESRSSTVESRGLLDALDDEQRCLMELSKLAGNGVMLIDQNKPHHAERIEHIAQLIEEKTTEYLASQERVEEWTTRFTAKSKTGK